MSATKLIVATEIERMLQAADNFYFSGHLPIPTVIAQPEKKYDFKFFPDKMQWSIGRGFTYLSDLDSLHIRFLHELAHLGLYALTKKIPSSANYHCAKYKQQALDLGLYVAKKPNEGWSHTTLTALGDSVEPQNVELQTLFLQTNGFPLNCFKLAQEQVASLFVKPPKQFFLKYVCKCPSPHNSIRTGRRPDGKHPLVAFCGECRAEFVCVGKKGELLKGKSEILSIDDIK